MPECHGSNIRLPLKLKTPAGFSRQGYLLNQKTAHRSRSADRTQSPTPISQKREFFKCPTETNGYFALRMPKIGAWRLVVHSQKPAIGGPFFEYQARFI